MFDATLSIDLGASYTKVSYRPVCIPDHVGTIEQQARILMFDNSPLIPSLAIRTRNSRQPWVFGWQAAMMNPTPEMQVFQNWKADLFRPSNDKDSATAAIIAHRFFEWLRSKLDSAGIDVRKCQTRVAMPAFDTFDENAVLLARCMDLSGWDNPTLILKVREPHANTLGLFAGGRNFVARNGEGLLQPQYGRMWGQDNIHIRSARGFTLFGTHSNLLTMMVVDIGAFTTDFAALTFDVTANEDGLSAIRQKSHALGVINQLDKPLFAQLGETHGFAWSTLQFSEAEDCKRRLYRRESSLLLTRANGMDMRVDLGGPADIRLMEQLSARFAAEIWTQIEAFITDVQPSYVFLTGGGSLIQNVAQLLTASLVARNIRVCAVEQPDADTDELEIGPDTMRARMPKREYRSRWEQTIRQEYANDPRIRQIREGQDLTVDARHLLATELNSPENYFSEDSLRRAYDRTSGELVDFIRDLDRLSWRHTGEGLQRLATALGGASVVLQAGAACLPQTPPMAREPIVTGQQTGHGACRCQGGNKDCCFCSGKGFVLRA